MSTRQAALSLYRRSLKLSLDWAVHRHLWRGQALYIRSLFEANKSIKEPRQIRALLKETETLLDTWKHPDPFCHPTAPGGMRHAMRPTTIDPLHVVRLLTTVLSPCAGSKFERNLPPPRTDPPPPLKF
ncbi:hypothetical protein RB601_005650 [Gaeumannomyces tritici]